jgi:hypothetical protein
MEVSTEEVSSEIRNIPEGAKYVGFDALLRAAEPSPQFLRKYSSQRDRFQECCQKVVAEQIMELKEQGEKEEAAFTMVIKLRVDVRYGSWEHTAQFFPPAEALQSATITNSVQQVSNNKFIKPKRESKLPEPKQESSRGKQKPKRTKGGSRVPSARQAAIRTMAKFLSAQSAEKLNAFIRAAKIQATLLQYSTARRDKTLQTRDKHGKVRCPADGWKDDESFELVQLYFFLGRAMVETFDTVANSNSSRKYSVGMYQDLMEGRDVNGLSRLARGMMMSTTCSLPHDESFVPYNTTAIRALLGQVGIFERKETSGRGFWTERGCVVSVALRLTPPNKQLLSPESVTTDDVDDSN